MTLFTLLKWRGLTNSNLMIRNYGPESGKSKNPYKGGLNFKIIYLFLVSLLMITSGEIWAQETVVDIFNLPEAKRCVSNDLRVVEASLDFDLCGPVCEEGKVIEYPLTLAIFNNTGSTRTSFAFFARLEQYNPDGTLANTYFITGCKGPVPPNTTTDITFDDSLEILDENGEPTEFDGVPYLCGGSLKLINLYQAWTDASDNDNRQCPLVAEDIAPKCDVLPSIEIQTPISAFVEDTTDVSCFGGNDGAIDITVNGGFEPYTFVWSKTGSGFSASTEDVINLSAGTYHVTVTDSEGCSITLEDIVIDQPNILDADVASEEVTCFGGNDGSITITNPTGGSGSYEYSIDGGSNWQVSGSFTGLSAESYNVQIRDSNAVECVITLDENLMIDEPSVLDADVSSENVSCFGGNDGSITITNPSGGSGSYEYSIDGGANWQTSGSFINLSADSYNVQIRDADVTDCVITLDNNLIIGEPDVLDADVASEDVECNGEAGGSITITNPTGGSGSYEYSIDGGANWQASGSFTGLPAGTYNVQIRDADAIECIIVLDDDLEIEQPFVLTADVASADVTCFDGSDGSITITNPSGGSGDYEYSIDGGANWQASGSFTGLSADSYNVQIRDANAVDCVITLDENLIIDQPDVLDADVASEDVSCKDGSDGSITISNPSGGSGDYEFSIDGGANWQASGSFTGLSADSYKIQIRDINAPTCIITLNEDLDIEEPAILAADVDSSDVSCIDGGGSITISNPSGGSGEYEYSIDGGTSWQMSGIFNSLSGGFYNVQIRDKNNPDCAIVLNNNLEIVDPGFPDGGLVVKDVTCFGGSDGSITVTVSGGVPPYKVNGNDVDETNIYVLSGLSAGFYGVTIEDANGCALAIDDIEVEEPPLLDPPTFETTQADCLGGNGGVVFTNIPSGQDLYYSINDGPFILYDGSISLPVADYTFVVRFGEDGCVSEEFPISIGRPQSVEVILETAVVEPDCETLLGSITVANPQGLFFTVTNQNTNVVYYNEESYPIMGFVNLPAGNYLVFGSSSDGCRVGSKLLVLTEPICDNFEGCTLGYWKNHTDRWCAEYTTCTTYKSIFGGSTLDPNLTLLQALNLKGNRAGENLARQSVAALLNICSGDVAFSSEFALISDLQTYVNAAWGPGALTVNVAGSHLDELNNAGCPLGGSRATTASTCAPLRVSNADVAGASSFSAYPVPFKETLNVKYDFNYKSAASIQIFDMQGRLLRSYKEKNAYNGKVTELSIDFRTRASQVYVIKITTDRDVFTKKVISDK